MCKWKKRNVKQIEFQHLPCEYIFGIQVLLLHYIKNVNHEYNFDKLQ